MWRLMCFRSGASLEMVPVVEETSQQRNKAASQLVLLVGVAVVTVASALRVQGKGLAEVLIG